MDAKDWEDRAVDGSCVASGDHEHALIQEMAFLNETLCLMMADLIRLLDKPVVNWGAR